jgi:hypothetical protein
MTLTDLQKEDFFEVAQGLYWYCADYHGGMGSTEYRVMCQLQYQPAPSENGPDGYETAQEVYAALERHELDVESVLAWVEQAHRRHRIAMGEED